MKKLKKLKMMLPVLAFVLAVVVTFASDIQETRTAYAVNPHTGKCESVEIPSECQKISGSTCSVIFESGPLSDPYDTLPGCESSDQSEILRRP